MRYPDPVPGVEAGTGGAVGGDAEASNTPGELDAATITAASRRA